MTRRQFLCFPMWLALMLVARPCKAAGIRHSASPLRIKYAIYQGVDGRSAVIRTSINGLHHVSDKKKRKHYSSKYLEGLRVFSVSPDGGHLLASVVFPQKTKVDLNDEIHRRRDMGWNDLMVLNFTTGHWTALTKDNIGYRSAQWSSDSRLIAYVSAAGYEQPLIETRRYARWKVYVEDVHTGNRRLVFQEDGNVKERWRSNAQMLCWLPGTHRLLYISEAPAGLFLLDAQGGKPILLSEQMPDVLVAAERRVAWIYYDRNDENQTYVPATLHTALLPSDSNTIKNAQRWSALPGTMTLSPPYPVRDVAVSPDGNRLSFMQLDRTGKLIIPVVIDMTHRTLVLLGTFPYAVGKLSWSRNGQYLLYAQSEYYNPGKGNKVFAIPATGGIRQPLANVNWKQAVAPLKTTVVLDLPEAGNLPFVWQEAK